MHNYFNHLFTSQGFHCKYCNVIQVYDSGNAKEKKLLLILADTFWNDCAILTSHFTIFKVQVSRWRLILDTKQIFHHCSSSTPDMFLYQEYKHTIYQIVTQYLSTRKVCAIMIPKNFNRDQRACWITVSAEMLERPKLIHIFLIGS
jgi:hypothetical protein